MEEAHKKLSEEEKEYFKKEYDEIKKKVKDFRKL